jgi:hypothetical protein
LEVHHPVLQVLLLEVVSKQLEETKKRLYLGMDMFTIHLPALVLAHSQ